MKLFLYKVAGAIAGFALGAVVGITALVLYIFGSHDPDLDAELDSWDWDDDEPVHLIELVTATDFRFVDDPARDEAWWAELLAVADEEDEL